MASLPPGPCCVTGSIHEGKAIGKFHDDLYGVAAYEVGDPESKNILIYCIDAFGHDFVNNNLLADAFSKSKMNFHVYIPDLIYRDRYDISQGLAKFPEWRERHTPEITLPYFRKFVAGVKANMPKDAKLFGVGYCFSSFATIEGLQEDGPFVAGAISHPSFVTEEAVDKIRKPILINAAENDPVFVKDLRYKTEELLSKNEQRYQINLFSGVGHGFAVRGDISIPTVKYAKEKVFDDIVTWFEQF